VAANPEWAEEIVIVNLAGVVVALSNAELKRNWFAMLLSC
jgi:hypothetical protein